MKERKRTSIEQKPGQITSPLLTELKLKMKEEMRSKSSHKPEKLLRFKMKESASREKLMKRMIERHEEAASFLKNG